MGGWLLFYHVITINNPHYFPDLQTVHEDEVNVLISHQSFSGAAESEWPLTLSCLQEMSYHKAACNLGKNWSCCSRFWLMWIMWIRWLIHELKLIDEKDTHNQPTNWNNLEVSAQRFDDWWCRNITNYYNISAYNQPTTWEFQPMAPAALVGLHLARGAQRGAGRRGVDVVEDVDVAPRSAAVWDGRAARWTCRDADMRWVQGLVTVPFWEYWTSP
jgi:hypothetical protein